MPEVTATKRPTAHTLQNVCIRTKEGAVYNFPDMNKKDVRSALPETGRLPEGFSSLMLVNASHAVLSIPLRIVSSVSVGEEELWAFRA